MVRSLLSSILQPHFAWRLVKRNVKERVTKSQGVCVLACPGQLTVPAYRHGVVAAAGLQKSGVYCAVVILSLATTPSLSLLLSLSDCLVIV